MILRPEYVDNIIAYMDAPFVKILTGVRRCGKSTIMNTLTDAGVLAENKLFALFVVKRITAIRAFL